jgi:hypothetical protein
MASCGSPEFETFFFFKKKRGHFIKKWVKLKGTKTWDIDIANF